MEGAGTLSHHTTAGIVPSNTHTQTTHKVGFFSGKKKKINKSTNKPRKLVINAHSLFRHFRAHEIFYHELRSVRCVTSGESMLVVP